MNWRERMNVRESKAELDVFIELQQRGLTTHLKTNIGFEFNSDVDGVHGTVPDFYFGSPYHYAVYLDGPPHEKSRRMDKDELIVKALERRGIQVDRFRYRSPLSKRRKMEICDKIEQKLKIISK